MRVLAVSKLHDAVFDIDGPNSLNNSRGARENAAADEADDVLQLQALDAENMGEELGGVGG